MNPCQFGEGSKLLSGIYHAPDPAKAGPVAKAVLVCPPVAQEYMRTHWILRQLADQLSREGYHVLRFDYSGTGDSYGKTEEASVAAWTKDVGLAAKELLEISGAAEFQAVGLRFGAALIARAGAERLLPTMKRLVLWDPVVDGAGYLEELRKLHDEMAESRQVAPVCENELLGFRFSPEWFGAVSSVRLLSALRALFDGEKAPRVSLVTTESRPEYETLAFPGVERASTREPALWGRLSEAHDAFLSNESVQAVVRMIASESERAK